MEIKITKEMSKKLNLKEGQRIKVIETSLDLDTLDKYEKGTLVDDIIDKIESDKYFKGYAKNIEVIDLDYSPVIRLKDFVTHNGSVPFEYTVKLRKFLAKNFPNIETFVNRGAGYVDINLI